MYPESETEDTAPAENGPWTRKNAVIVLLILAAYPALMVLASLGSPASKASGLPLAPSDSRVIPAPAAAAEQDMPAPPAFAGPAADLPNHQQCPHAVANTRGACCPAEGPEANDLPDSAAPPAPEPQE